MKKSFECVLAATLLLFCAVTAVAITQKQALDEIFPGSFSFKMKKSGNMDYFEVSKGGSVTGYCIIVTAIGYGGPIYMIVGIDPSGGIKGIRILAHCETPGIGARINETVTGDKEPWFLRQFVGKRAGHLVLNQDVDAVSGATISSRAVTDAVNSSVKMFLSGLEKAGAIKKLER